MESTSFRTIKSHDIVFQVLNVTTRQTRSSDAANAELLSPTTPAPQAPPTPLAPVEETPLPVPEPQQPDVVTLDEVCGQIYS